MSEYRGNPFSTEDIAPEHQQHWDATRRVAKGLQEMTELLVTSHADSAELNRLAEVIDEFASVLRNSPRIYGKVDFVKNGSYGGWGEVSHELNPLSGISNPLAPPVEFEIKDNMAIGRAKLGWAYEGPPGCVHGGFVAAIFDQFLGVAQLLGDRPGMTGNLSVDYHKPTPLNTELRLEARLVKVEGRKTVIRGEMYAAGELTASSECLFVYPRQLISEMQPHPAATGTD